MEKGHPLARVLLGQFLARYLEDQERDAIHSLEEYRALFPRIADLLEEEFLALQGRNGAPSSEPSGATQASSPLAQDIDERIRLDRAAGIEPTLGEYLERFPSRERDVADAVARFADEAALHDSGPDLSPDLPAQLAGYEIVRELGRGGQATVYLARDPKLDRSVALKVFVASKHLPTSTARMRFEREAFTAARLDHPNLCAIYEVGQEDQVAFIAMRYVPGESLCQRIARARESANGQRGRIPALLTPPDSELNSTTESRSARGRLTATLRMIEELARAVHVAHEAGILHRDIKPSNVILTPEGHPVLLDFGLALSGDDESLPSLTRTGDQIGTPRYMSPEQVRADGRPLDRRTDVYSLGVTLFECLTGRSPFEEQSIQALYKSIVERDAPRAHRLVREIPEDLSTVLEVALEKDPERRYATALEFAQDLRRVIEHQPILARSASAVYQAKKFARRHRGLVAGAIATLVASVLGTAVATWFGLEARSMARLAEARETEATQVAYRATYETCMRALADGDRVAAAAAVANLPNAPQGWETRHLEAYLGEPGILRDTGLRWGAIAMGFWDGEVPVAVVDREGEGVLIDVRSGDPLVHLGPVAIRYWLLEEPPWIIAEWSTELAVLDYSGAVVCRCPFPDEVMGVFAAATSDALVVLTSDGVFGFDIPSGEQLFLRWPVSWPHEATPPEGLRSPLWSYGLATVDGSQVAFISTNGSTDYLELIDARTGELIREVDAGLDASIHALRTSPAGTSITALSNAGIHDFTLPDLVRSPSLVDHSTYAIGNRGYRGSLSYQEGGDLLVVARRNEGVYGFDSRSGELRFKEKASFEVSQAELSPSGEWLLMGEIHADRQQLQLKRLAQPPRRVLTEHETYVYAAAFHPDSRLLATGDFRGNVLLWDPLDGSLLASWQAESAAAICELWFSDDGGWLIARPDGSFDGPLLAWDLATGKQRSFPSRDAADFPTAPAGAILDSSSGWTVTPVRAVAVGPNRDARVIGFRSSGNLTASRASSGQLLAVERAHQNGIRAVGASLDGRWIASGGETDGKARIWSWPKGELVVTLPATTRGAVHTVAFHPDSSRLVTGGSDGVLRIWDTRTFKLAAELDGHQDYIHCVVFSPDGTMLVSASGDRTVRIWDTVPSYVRADTVAAARARRGELRSVLDEALKEHGDETRAARSLLGDPGLPAADRVELRRLLLAD